MKSNKDRILLMEPPFYRLFKDTYSLDRHPLSLGYLSGMIIKKTNWRVMTYNADFFARSERLKVGWLAGEGFSTYLNNLSDSSRPIWREIESVLTDFKPDVVGISCKSQNFSSARMVARIAKKINMKTLVIVGGPHPSMIGPEILQFSEFDVSVKGEAENTIVELLNAISAEKEFDDIRGIVFRKNGKIIENAPRELIDNVDSICFPHEGTPKLLKNYEQYPTKAFRNIFATRGCPFNCFFCGSRKVWGRKTRFRSTDNVVREIDALQKRGLRAVNFSDDIFGGANIQYITELCNALVSHRPRIKWSCETHVKLVKEEIISLMKKAGCFEISLGIESGNNEILKQIRKNITIEEALSAADIIKKHKILLNVFFMVGFPQETEETLKDTLAAIEKIKCNQIFYSIFTPYPGTEAFDFCKKNGLIDDDFDVSLYNHQSPANFFCLNFSQEKFRTLVSKIEQMVDKRNAKNRARQSLSLNTLWRIKELGIRRSLKEGVKIIRGK